MASQFRAKKSIDRMIADSELSQFRLNKSLGPWSMVAIGVGAIIGEGIYLRVGIAAGGWSYPAPPALYRSGFEMIWQLFHSTLSGRAFHSNPPAGPAVVLSFLIPFLVCILIGLCYSELASLMPLAGSVYSYSYAALGELAAWLTGWILVLEYGLNNVVVASVLSGELRARLADFNIFLPDRWSMPLWSEGKWTGAYFNVPAFLMLLAVTVVLSLGVRVFSRANIFLVILKSGALIFFLVIGSSLIHPANYHPFAPGGSRGVLGAGLVLFFLYAGFDCISVAAEEARQPERDVAVGILGSLAICALLYIGVAVVLVGIVPYTAFSSGASASNRTVLNALRQLGAKPLSLGMIAAGMLTGLFSLMFVLQYGLTRLWYAMSRDGLVPEVFSSLHPKTRTPHWCVWIGGAAVALLTGLINIGEAADLATNGILVAFALVAICVMRLRKGYPDHPRPFRVPWVPWLPLASLAATLVMMASLPVISWVRFLAWMAIGLAIYFSYGRRYSTIAARSLPEAH